MAAAFLYILRCSDGSYYVGSTRASLEERIAQHNAGTFGGYTARRRSVTLLFHQEFDRITDAITAERQIKNWSRAKKGSVDAWRLSRAQDPGVGMDEGPEGIRYVPRLSTDQLIGRRSG